MSLEEKAESAMPAGGDNGAGRQSWPSVLAGSDGGGGDGTSLGTSWEFPDGPEASSGRNATVPVLRIGKYGLAGAEVVGRVPIATAVSSSIGPTAARQVAVRLS